MLLAIDIGNTNIKMGVFDGQELRSYWRVSTERLKLADEYAALIGNLFELADLRIRDVSGCAISCVVPPLAGQFRRLARDYLRVEPVVIGPDIETGLRFAIDTPRELGADRVANSLAALRRHGQPVIAIAFGTATAFDVLDREGTYVGGAIAPGIGISADALFRNAARLYQVELAAPPQPIGKNTVHYMQSGLILGYAGLVEGLVARMQQQLGYQCNVVATGGLADVIASQTSAVTAVDPYLTLEGLRLIYDLNKV